MLNIIQYIKNALKKTTPSDGTYIAAGIGQVVLKHDGLPMTPEFTEKLASELSAMAKIAEMLGVNHEDTA